MTEPTEELDQFFDTIWGDAQGFVYLPTLDRKSSDWKKYFFTWPEDKTAIKQFCLAMSAQGKEVYCAPALFNKKDPHKENVKGSHVLWTEFDGNAPESWRGAPVGEGEPENGSQGLHGVPEPSLRIQSSKEGNQHVYWRLEEFNTDISWLENANRSIAYTLRADTSGWDANQILRPPGTTNYKHDLPVTTVFVRNGESGAGVFRVHDFSSLKRPLQLVDESINTDDLPTVEGVIAKYPWDEEHFKMFMSSAQEEGNRSSALMRLGYFGAEVGMSDAELFAVLLNADDRWGKFKHRADRRRRLLDIVNRAREKHPRALTDLTFSGLTNDRPVETENRILYNFGDFMKAEVNVTWLIEDLLEVGGFGMVAAKPGVGKTQLSIQLGICAALGSPFLTWKVVRPLKVLLLSLEMSMVSLRRLMDTVSQGYTEQEKLALSENFILAPIAQSIHLDRPEGLALMETLIGEVKPDLIIIDSVSKLSSGEVSSEATAKKLNDQYIHLRQKYGVSLWLIHHNRKESGENSKPTDLSDVYGSVFLTAEMTSVIILWKNKDKSLELIPVKLRLSPEMDAYALLRDTNLKFSVGEKKAAEMKLENVGAGLMAGASDIYEKKDDNGQAGSANFSM